MINSKNKNQMKNKSRTYWIIMTPTYWMTIIKTIWMAYLYHDLDIMIILLLSDIRCFYKFEMHNQRIYSLWAFLVSYLFFALLTFSRLLTLLVHFSSELLFLLTLLLFFFFFIRESFLRRQHYWNNFRFALMIFTYLSVY